MSSHGFATVAEISSLITAGHILLLAGDEALLAKLPAGNWIAGTSADFMTAAGGIPAGGMLFYTDLTEDAESVEIQCLPAAILPTLAAKYPANGFAILILPGMSAVLQDFAQYGPEYKDVYTSPLAGWVSTPSQRPGAAAMPKIFAGLGKGFSDHAAIMYVTLPYTKIARLDILNLFTPRKNIALEFIENGFTATDCRINGKITNLISYLHEQNIDSRLPLIADHDGALINIAIQSIDSTAGIVTFYGPLRKDIVYRFAEPLPDYAARLQKAIRDDADAVPVFCCNCVLNYIYGELEGKLTAPFFGPTSFGEIAYTLLNQTMVYLSIDTLED